MSYSKYPNLVPAVRSVMKSTFSQLIRQVPFVLLPTLAIVALWAIAANLLNDPGTLPGPLAVLEQTYTVLTTPDAFGYTAVDHTWITFYRAMLMSVVILALSVVLGVVMAIHKPTEDSLINVLPFAMTAPEVVVLLLCLVWVGFTFSGVALALVIVITPFGAVNIWKGAQDLDTEVLEMANSFNLSSLTIWRHIFIPHLLPYILSSYRYLLAMTWKVTMVGEVFGLQTGLGSVFRTHFQIGNIDVILAYLVIFIPLVLALEYLVLKPMENVLFQWR